MSARKGLIGQARDRIDSIPEPNRHIPMITADCRVYFPPNATRPQIMKALASAYDNLIRQVIAETLPGPLKNQWLTPNSDYL